MSHTLAAEPGTLPPLVSGKLEWNWVGNTHAEFVDDQPSGMGLCGSALVRVDGWLKGKRELRWTAPLLLDDAKLPPKAICQAGDCIFAAACQPTAGFRGVIYVYSAKDEKLVGRISGAKEFTQRTGWVDLSLGLRARKLPDGRYWLLPHSGRKLSRQSAGDFVDASRLNGQAPESTEAINRPAVRDFFYTMKLKHIFSALALVAFVHAPSLLAAENGNAAAYRPLALPDTSAWGRNIQRTMRLLSTSTAEQRNTVRILFYGQSITEQKWAKMVEDDLRRRFPHANLVIENRALGGFASQLLVKTAETDLYSFQPDLLIFHVYGSHDKYEDIIRRTRERTTAEILMQNDHITKLADLTEETEAAKLPPAGQHWDAFMNHNFLPSLAKKYGAELCDQRALWKAYLAENKLEPKALLKDGVHLNAHGEWFMAECVKAYLRYDPKLGPSPAEDWVRTYEVGKDVRWTDGKLRLEFEGSRVEVICKPSAAGAASVRIDGRKPSEFAELYGVTRAVTKPEGKWLVKWPVLAPIGSQKPLLVEDWSLAVTKDAANDKLFTFTLTGSKTGPDGEGRSDARFVSKSGRVVIETNDWNVTYAMALAGIKPLPEKFNVQWKVEPRFVDDFISPGAKNPAIESTVTLAQGLPNTKHTLEISGSAATPIAAIRVYRPALSSIAKVTNR